MKKVVYIVSTLKRTGPVNSLLNIVRHLDRQRYLPVIITLSPEPAESMITDFQELGVIVEQIGASRITSIFRTGSKVRNLVEKHLPVAVHTQGVRADIYSAIYLKGYYRLATLRNFPYYDYPMTYGKITGIFMAKTHLHFLKKLDNVYVCSRTIAQMIIDKCNISFKYIQNGVNTEIYKIISSEEKRKLRKKIGLPSDAKVFISVGHLSQRKDPETVIKGFIGSNYGKSAVLVMVGDGERKGACQSLIGNRENILLLGRRDKVFEYYMASDYFISASLAEGLPNTVLEAMACGVPVVLSDIPPHQEIVEGSVLEKYLFNIRDINGLSVDLNGLDGEDYKSISLECLDIIKRKFNSVLVSSRYQEIYDNASYDR